MKNVLIALVVIIVLAVGGYYFFMADDAMPTPDTGAQNGNVNPGGTSEITDEERGEPVIVTYTGSAYAPASVTIAKGQTVRFVNEADAETWPASSIHPTHGVYPEKTDADCLGSAFDACRGLKKGESWEFTFNQVGTWRYHDHLHAQHTGSIIVTE